ncbi:MAG: ASKHA domain-containing protein [Thermodesulfobacteriota bacterium]|nr:ASKHA domain-containing protein [Thermodesulfobacteriota bacterium]
MINVYIKELDINIEIEKGMNLYQAIEKAGIKIETPCGGKGVCGKCRVWVQNSDKVPFTPHKDITKEEAAQGLRLACQLVPEQDISVKLGENFSYQQDTAPKGKILEAQKIFRDILDPAIEIISRNGDFKLKYDREADTSKPFSWESEYEPTGFAIDIGTTTIAVSLVSLKTGKILASDSSLNPQTALGHDVITRIQHASTPAGLKEMTKLVQNELNRLLDTTCRTLKFKKNEVIDVTIGGNTTMLQLAAGIDPSPLGVVPFKFDIIGGKSYPAKDFGLKVNNSARVYLPPVIHAYVGSDISAGLLSCSDFFNDDKVIIYIDLGTNGEICLNARGRRYTTATATGPAFEGMSISSGMRAEYGAIEHVEIVNSHFKFQTIGNSEIRGVCGSGIVDFIAALLKTGALDSSGKLLLNKDTDSPKQENKARVVQVNNKKSFLYGKGIYLTQKDIRQIQMAKGAIRSGIDIILKKGNISPDKIDKLYLAGGFGKYLNPYNMERIGIIPEHTAEKLVFIGNASIDGSITLLTDVNQRYFLEKNLKTMEHLELANSPEFMDSFIKNLSFP